jgi:photosystem II stability/assembly factor-like uncharacterized protein
MPRHAVPMLVACVLAIAGCGSSGESSAGALVDATKEPPFVNALEIDPASGDFLLATNTGFFRIERDSGDVRRVRATISAEGRMSMLGTFLQFTVAGRDQLIGSGHPDQETLPNFLGLIVSADGGDTWRPVARLGSADLHKIVLAHDRLYAFDAVLGAMLISRDGGRTFSERFFQDGAVIDFEVDPSDPQRIVASNEDQLFRSSDGGASWDELDRAVGIRLAWPARDALYRALEDGTVERSADGGDTWRSAASVEGEPYRFKRVGRDELYLVLGDATIMHTTDGAKTWEAVFSPSQGEKR